MIVSSDAGRFVAWGNAYLTGAVSLDEAALAITGEIDVHRVEAWDDSHEVLAVTHALGLIRGSGVTGLRLVLPVPGDVVGVPGPASAAALAAQAGEAVVTVAESSVPAHMLIPSRAIESSSQRSTTLWTPTKVDVTRAPFGLPTLSEAERQLTQAMADSTQALTILDTARGRSELAGEIAGLTRATEHINLPPSLSARAQRMIASGHRLRGIVDLARRTDGAGVSASSANLRRDALTPLDQAARYALCAAYSAQVELVELDKLRRGFSR